MYNSTYLHMLVVLSIIKKKIGVREKNYVHYNFKFYYIKRKQ